MKEFAGRISCWRSRSRSRACAKGRGLKARIYAEFGVEELWVIDANVRKTYRHREAVDGQWSKIEIIAPSATLTHEMLPGLSIRLDQIA